MPLPPSFRRFFLGLLPVAALAPALLRAQALPAAAQPEGTAATAAAPSAPIAASQVESSVVKIFSTMRLPNFVQPWTRGAAREATGSGVIIAGQRILTNAHVVLYASQVQVQANQSGEKFSATVEAISPGMDLAVLKLEDAKFFDGRPPLPFADKLPAIKDTVHVYGFPTGGNNLSITRGIVSRIEFSSYNFPVSGLRIQIDAAINPGNSGGPAVVGDKMIGLAFSRLSSGDNIGYIIPTEEIELFLADVADGKYDGKPMMFDEIQTLENDALRPYLKVDRTVHGAIVHLPDSTDPNYPIKEWDIITKIGDVPVDDEAMSVVGDLRLRFDYFIQKIAKNGKVPLTVVRNGKEIQVELPVPNTRPMLIGSLEGEYPSYFIYGPMTFSPATSEFISSVGGASAMNYMSIIGSPLALRRGDKPAFADEELVVVSSRFFPHKLSLGYSDAIGRVVSKVNGTPVKNLDHLVALLRDSKADFTVIEFAGKDQETIVLPHKAALAATEEILDANSVRSQGSPDVMSVWNTKPAGN